MHTPNLHHGQEHPPEPPPPVFKTWNQLYAFVIILHAFIIALFYIFTKMYS